jgi:hypothetical protein
VAGSRTVLGAFEAIGTIALNHDDVTSSESFTS